MRNILIALSLTGMMTTGAAAETWIAVCNDGKNFQYNQTVDGNGFLYLKGEDQASGGYQIAPLYQTFYNGTAICGTVRGNGTGTAATGGNPITQICANRSRNTIYMKYKHPTEDRPFDSAVYCSATVEVR
jgi:hypothetical protein